MADADAWLRLHSSAAHNMQKKVWETDQKAFDKRLQDEEDELRSVRDGVYKVIGMYTMFQGVIFMAVSQSSLLNCALAWCPGSLCTVVYLATIVVVVEQLMAEDLLKNEIMETKLLLSSVNECLDRVNQHGVELDLETEHPKVPLAVLGHTSGFRCLLSFYNLLHLIFLTIFFELVCWLCVGALCNNCRTCQG
ncbi:hypothetical protein KP509_34G050700 [Ceratopteris richardii]|uniref:Uncharacterized protein n=1 Tax=Ceratopteris richardii TaxID=49495 RepID=A0A8T2QLH8_CERRI|nr:hypothetical protein KP509_34G050700 [Ceratopteris richardii]